MCMFIFMYMHMCMHMYLYRCIYLYIHICVCVWNQKIISHGKFSITEKPLKIETGETQRRDWTDSCHAGNTPEGQSTVRINFLPNLRAAWETRSLNTFFCYPFLFFLPLICYRLSRGWHFIGGDAQIRHLLRIDVLNFIFYLLFFSLSRPQEINEETTSVTQASD